MSIGIDTSRLTPTEQRIFARLSDGSVHSRESLVDCLHVDLGDAATVAVHVCSLRKKLPSQLIIHHVRDLTTRVKGYQLLRHISSGE